MGPFEDVIKTRDNIQYSQVKLAANARKPGWQCRIWSWGASMSTLKCPGAEPWQRYQMRTRLAVEVFSARHR